MDNLIFEQISFVFWMGVNLVFPLTLIFNFIYLKRWKSSSKLEMILYVLFIVSITCLSQISWRSFYEINENLAYFSYLFFGHEENYMNATRESFYYLNFAYNILLLVISAIIVLNAVFKEKMKRIFLCVSHALIVLFLACIAGFIIEDYNLNAGTAFEGAAPYFRIIYMIFAFMSFLLLNNKKQKLYMIFAAISICMLIFTEVSWVVNIWIPILAPVISIEGAVAPIIVAVMYITFGIIPIGLLLLRYKKLKGETVK